MIQGILFDLDGTLADTAPDLGWCLNTLLARYHKPPVSLDRICPTVSQGARGLIQLGFGIDGTAPFYLELQQEFLTLYENHYWVDSALYDGVLELLEDLVLLDLPWGIVTNKAERFTTPIVSRMLLPTPPACVVCGDTFERAKPYPDPLLGAANIMNIHPRNMIYVGDDSRDMEAAQAADMRGIWACFNAFQSPTPKHFDALIRHPLELKKHYRQ